MRSRIVVIVKAATGAAWTVRHVAELARRGHDVVALLPAGSSIADPLRRGGITVREAPFDFRFRPTLRTLRQLRRLRRLCRELRPDVVLYYLYASALAARLATLRLPVRRVHVVAGPLYLESPLIRPVERLLGRLDDVTVCCTQDTSRRYAELGWPAARRPVVTFGTDVDRFAPPPGPPGQARAKARAELGLDPDLFVVVMVAYVYPGRPLVHRGRPVKGHDVLFTAWPRFRRRHPDGHLLLVGGGYLAGGDALRRRLLRRYRVAGDPGVTWVGSVDDVRPYYTAADVSVSPSRSEGHGAPVEALAMGVPAIVSAVGGLPEVVGADCGWAVPPDDPDALLAGLETAYREFADGRLADRGARGRQRIVADFDARVGTRQIADIVEAAAAGGGR